MNDESQQPVSESKVEHSDTEQNVAPPPEPRKSKRNPWIMAGIVLVMLCLCSIVCVSLVRTGVDDERAPVEATLDTFLKDLAAKDTVSAFALFSPRAQRQISITELEDLVEGNNYLVVEGYKSIAIENLKLTAVANTNPNVPQGTVANVTAVVHYDDGFTGNLTAVLEKVDDEWRLFNFNVVVPPDKFQP